MAMHQDRLVAHVWGLQLDGRKRFVFCPESELQHCIASSGVTVDAFNSSTWGTQMLTKDDTNSTSESGPLPAFRPAACYHVSLEPGDLVYWPSRWLHQSYQQERSVALSSFSLGKNISSAFFASMDRFFENTVDASLVAQMRRCSSFLPE